MTNPETFDHLPLQKKAEAVWSEGYLIESRISTPHQYFQLHRMRGFYAELACDVEAEKITAIRIIPKEEAANRYQAFRKTRML